MLRRRTAIFVVTGVVRNDPARNIWIPSELTTPPQLQVAFNDTQICFRRRWPAKEPHVPPTLPTWPRITKR